MLGSKFLNKKEKINFFVKKFNNAFKSFTGFYIDSLKYWINRQKTISIFIIFIIAASTYPNFQETHFLIYTLSPKLTKLSLPIE